LIETGQIDGDFSFILVKIVQMKSISSPFRLLLIHQMCIAFLSEELGFLTWVIVKAPSVSESEILLRVTYEWSVNIGR
jgi:hypothetical protein